MERERKVEEFAKRIIQEAHGEWLSVAELREATYLARQIANESAVESTAIDKTFPAHKNKNYSGAFDWR